MHCFKLRPAICLEAVHYFPLSIQICLCCLSLNYSFHEVTFKVYSKLFKRLNLLLKAKITDSKRNSHKICILQDGKIFQFSMVQSCEQFPRTKPNSQIFGNFMVNGWSYRDSLTIDGDSIAAWGKKVCGSSPRLLIYLLLWPAPTSGLLPR